MSVPAQALTELAPPLAWQLVSLLGVLGALTVTLRWWFHQRKR